MIKLQLKLGALVSFLLISPNLFGSAGAKKPRVPHMARESITVRNKTGQPVKVTLRTKDSQLEEYQVAVDGKIHFSREIYDLVE